MKYRVPILEQYVFQPPVIDKDLSSPESGFVKGDRYIVGSVASGDWLGKEKNIAWYDGTIWKFDAPIKGMLLWINDEGVFYFYNNSGVWELLTSAMGLGDMLKSVYDINGNNIVDKAETVDDGLGNASTAADVKDAVTKKHAHTNIAVLNAIEEAFTTTLKNSYNQAVIDSHTHSNKVILDAIEVAFTTVLEGKVNTAYNSRGQYDSEVGAIFFDI